MIEVQQGLGNPDNLKNSKVDSLPVAAPENKEVEQKKLFSLALGIPGKITFKVRVIIVEGATEQGVREFVKGHIPKELSLDECAVSVSEISEKSTDIEDGEKRYAVAIGAMRLTSSGETGNVVALDAYSSNDRKVRKGAMKLAKKMYPAEEGYRKHMISFTAVPE